MKIEGQFSVHASLDNHLSDEDLKEKAASEIGKMMGYKIRQMIIDGEIKTEYEEIKDEESVYSGRFTASIDTE